MERLSFERFERVSTARHTAGRRRSWLVTGAALVVALSLMAGCKSKQAAAPPTDQQLTGTIQSRIQSESALAGQNILISVTNGVVTLSGTVPDAASRALAANDAGEIPGVKTVVNDITVEPEQPAEQQAQPQTEAAPPPEPVRESRPAYARHERSRSSQREQASQAPPPPQQMHPYSQQQQRAMYQPPAQPAAPPPPPQPVVQKVTLPAGTVVPVILTENLNSKNAYANEAFHGTLASDLMSNGMVAIPRGAPVLGQVVDAKAAAHFKGRALLSIDLTQISSYGRKIYIQTDSFSKEGNARGKNTAEKAGGGALLGALVGALAGGGKGAAIGALAGGGAGAGVNAVTRGQEVEIPSETRIDFHLQAPVTLTVTNHPSGSQQQSNEPQLQQRSTPQ